MGKQAQGLTIVAVAQGSGPLAQVVDIADRNARFLGHFPRSCFDREAGRGMVLAAIGADDKVCGFVLYRRTRDRAVVQQLCVDQPYRRAGVGRALCDELRKRTADLPRIVCHCAREFEAIEAWKRLGFVPMDEKPGRGESRRPLVRLVLDQGHTHLFSDGLVERAAETIVVAIDLNVALALQDHDPSDTEIEALRADWLQEEVSLWVTDEALSEVERQDDDKERRRRMAYLRGQSALARHQERESRAMEALQSLIGAPRRTQDHSDLRQLAQSIAGDADVFLTRDEGILRYAHAISATFGLDVFRPVDLIVSLDEIARSGDYAPERLRGTSIGTRRPRQGELDAVIERFLDHGRGEKKHALAALVREAVIDTVHCRVVLVTSRGDEMLGLLIVSTATPNRARITALRVLKNRLSETLTRHLLQDAVREASKSGFAYASLDESFPLHPLETAAAACGFTRSDSRWTKWSPLGLHDRSAIPGEHDVAAEPEMRLGTEAGVAPPHTRSRIDEAARDAGIENLIWPGRLRASPLRTFVVPIQPRFAAHLFDADLSARSVFGGDPALLLNCENVYYRSSHVQVVASPSRVLWYVSGDQTERVREVRACSTVIGTHVGPASEMFRRFKRLGVYEWKDLLAITGGDPDGQVMSIHFGATETFPNPVPGRVVRPMIARHRGTDKPPPLSMPVEVPCSCFEEIWETAHGTAGSTPVAPFAAPPVRQGSGPW